MGQASSSTEDEFAEAHEYEHEKDLEEEADGVEENDSRIAKEGFNMVFSPELVQRLQTKSLDEAGEAERGDADLYEKETVEDELALRQHAAAERTQQLQSMAAEEVRQLREIDRLLASDSLREFHAEAAATAPTCATEEAGCMKCLQENGNVAECQDVINKFNECVLASR